jgi:3,4-dihydroxy 2-butanone 4-phosphate synthase/GTP cyclohydrolase II
MKTKNARPLDSIESAIQELRAGRMIIVVDDENRENEGDFVMAAEMITPEAVNFMVTVGKGLICTPLSRELAKKFDLRLQVEQNTASLGTAFTVTIDAKEKISTGISASDRSHTIKLLTDQKTSSEDFVRPGHIFPLIAKDGGVLERPGHTEASVDLARLAGFSSVGVICEIINPDGSMARFPDLCELADKHNLKMISIEELITFRKIHENLISNVETVPLPTKFGEFSMSIFRSELLKQEHVAIIKGSLTDLKTAPTLVRIHSECFTGDILGSLRCDCGEQLAQSLRLIEKQGSGLVIYLRQEGRGIGLFNKLRAYQLQDQGLDTVEANLHLGLPVDSRDYTMASQILRHFGIQEVRLLTNNPLKLSALKNLGVQKVHREALEIDPHHKNAHYLLTKKIKLGHMLKQSDLN